MRRKLIIITYFVLMTILANAQGFYIYQTDGSRLVYFDNEVDSIVRADLNYNQGVKVFLTNGETESYYNSNIERIVAFENFEAQQITVKTGDASNISDVEAIVSGEIYEAIETLSCGIIYGTNSYISDSNGKKVETSSKGTFHVTLTELTPSTVYYYCAYAIVNGNYVLGETKSFKTGDKTTFCVGEFYPNDTNPEGVVFYVDATGKHGKIVSLTQEWCKWAESSFGANSMGNYDVNDGSNSVLPNNSSLKAFITSLGSGWYCPAKGELSTMCNVVEKLNSTLKKGGYKELYGFYYSCNDYYSNVYVVTVCGSGGFCGYSNGYTFYVSKDNSESGRGVKKF